MKGLIHVGAWDGSEYLDPPNETEAHAGRAPWDGKRELLLIEPQAAGYAALVANFGECKNVHLSQVACGARSGHTMMFSSDPPQSTSLLPPVKHLKTHPHIRFDGHREFTLVEPLDVIVALAGGPYDEMIVDVQGYELEVLRGAPETLAALRWVMLEVTAAEEYRGNALVGEIDAYLEPLGFRRTATDLYGVDGSYGDAIYER